MPGPVFPPKADAKPARQTLITNIRNTTSGHWKPWLAATSVAVGKDKNAGGRCIVPVAAFAEPGKSTSKLVVNRWFGRADGLPFFLPVSGVSGPATMALSPSPTSPSTGKPVHENAMPVMLLTADDVKCWPCGSAVDALELQTPALDKSIVVRPSEKNAA